jgi:alpha-L-fucosidase
MRITRRAALKSFAAAAAALGIPARGGAAEAAQPIASGPFQATRASLAAWQVPDWFRNAKFGIWAHWGPQSSVEAGDWYARNMYMEGSPQYKHHVETYGHPSKVGYKDVIPRWKAERFDPAALMGLYRKAGARYFMSMAVHHDNFDLWNSAHTRWNSVGMGPRRDVVGEFATAARREGLRFAVSDHLWISYKWFSTCKGHDRTGPMAGVPYDGVQKENFDLYHDITEVHSKLDWNDVGIPDAWKQMWFRRIKDLVDKYDPDLLYNDGPIPFEDTGLAMLAHLYNRRAAKNGGVADTIYTSKRREDSETGTCVFDVERGVVDAIWPRPWQTDTCIGHWHYERGITYKTPKTVVDLLADIVSRNGNLMLNFPLPNSGMLDDQELKVLAGITDWMAVNSEAIYDTRPWKIFGDGPVAIAPKAAASSSFNEKERKDLGPDDVRFTTKGDVLYAIVMGWPGREALIPALAPGGAHAVGKVQHVDLVGAPGAVEWSQDAAGLRVTLPAKAPSDYAVVFRVRGA